MKVTFYNRTLKGSIRACSSKSVLHRLLICAALSGEPCRIGMRGFSKDIEATLSAVGALGARFEKEENAVYILPGEIKKEADVKESGSTFRFMLPVLSAFGKGAVLTGSQSLAARPISPLYEELLKNGAVLSEKGVFPLKIEGKISGGTFYLPGDVSSQYVSGLLMALPITEMGGEIILTSPLMSRPYVDITLKCLSLFKIEVKETDKGFFVKGGQKYISPGDMVCEGDHSNAAFFIAAEYLSGEKIEIKDLDPNSSQGDKAFGDILKRLPGEIDLENTPDLAPIACLCAALTPGDTRFTGCYRLRFKESDRIFSVTETLKKLGAVIFSDEDSIYIKGQNALLGGEVSSFNDHRIAMTAAIASVKCKNPVTVSGFEAVNKSYPDFLKDFSALGGAFTIEE